MKIRLQKFLAERGLASRRKVEAMIKAGRIKVNGKQAELGLKVSDKDKIEIDGSLFAKALGDKIYIMFNKPRGVLSTCEKSKEQGKTVLDYIQVKERIYPIGRLDKDSEGMLLLTNDGELALKLTHPRYEHEKEYFVRYKEIKKLSARGGLALRRQSYGASATSGEEIKKLGDENVCGESGELRIEDRFNNKLARRLEGGVDIGGYITKKSTVKALTLDSFLIILKEGKKRQIRLMCEVLGLKVIELKRVRIGRLKLDDLKSGAWRHLSPSEAMLLKSG